MQTGDNFSQDEDASPFSQRELLTSLGSAVLAVLICQALVALLVLAAQTISTP